MQGVGYLWLSTAYSDERGKKQPAPSSLGYCSATIAPQLLPKEPSRYTNLLALKKWP